MALTTSIPIQGIWEHLGIVLPEQTRSEQQAVSNALPTMEKLALLQRDGDDWSMHSLVQLAVRNRMGDRVDEYAQSAVRVVIAMFPEDPAEASQAAECEPLIPHALAVLEPEIRDAEGRVPSDSADVSELHRRLGLFALGRSDYDDAARRLARAREIAETVLEPDDPELAKYRRDVGRLYIWMGRLEEAEEIWRRELEFAERAHGSDHVDVAAALGNLAQVMSVSERLDEAESLHRRALAIIERALGPDHSGVARSLSSLGYVLGKMGRNREAEPLLRRALAIQQAADGKDDSNASETERELAALLHRTSRLKEAIEIMDHVLETQRSVRGEPNPQTARDLDFIGRIRRDMGELNVVREALARVLKLRTEADPQTGPRMRAR